MKKQLTKRLNNSAGFTLIELVLAFGLLALIIGVSYGALDGMLKTRALLDDGRAAEALANSIITRFSRELQLADARETLLPNRSDPDTKFPTNVCLVGLDSGLPSQNQGDGISFMARGAGQYVPGGSGYSGLVKITYRVEQAPERRAGNTQTYYLVREETPAIKPLTRAFEHTMIFPITSELVSLNFRYYNQEDDTWYKDWGTEQHTGVPSIIEYAIKLRSPAGQIQSYIGAVPMRGKPGTD